SHGVATREQRTRQEETDLKCICESFHPPWRGAIVDSGNRADKEISAHSLKTLAFRYPLAGPKGLQFKGDRETTRGVVGENLSELVWFRPEPFDEFTNSLVDVHAWIVTEHLSGFVDICERNGDIARLIWLGVHDRAFSQRFLQ